MNNSDHKGNQDVDPLKPIGPKGLPKKIWNRLSGRSKLPRCKLPRWLWFPSNRHLDLAGCGSHQNGILTLMLMDGSASMMRYPNSGKPTSGKPTSGKPS